MRILTPEDDPSTKTRGRIVGIPVPEDILPTPGVGSALLATVTFQFIQPVSGGEIGPPDEGYRYVYYHELFANADFLASVYAYM